MNKAQSLRQRWSVTARWRQPARGSQARNRLATPVTGVDVINALDRARPRWQGRSGLADQLLEGFIHAHDGALGVIRAVVDLQHVFQVEDELRRGLVGDAPHPSSMRLEGVLF